MGPNIFENMRLLYNEAKIQGHNASCAAYAAALLRLMREHIATTGTATVEYLEYARGLQARVKADHTQAILDAALRDGTLPPRSGLTDGY